MKERTGFIAILDALGAASYSSEEIAQFLESRQIVLDLLGLKAEAVFGPVEAGRLSTFTFNDSVVIAYEVGSLPSLDDIGAFGSLLRHFEVKSLANGILFRGALAIGMFHSDNEKNTIMGKAVTDAAAWYDKADWIGIAATPHASLLIRSRQGAKDIENVLIDYPVPMKDKTVLSLRAVNWPKGFYVKGLRPQDDGEDPKCKCLEFLSRSGIPRGTEGKYFNTVAFFDHCIQHYQDQRKRKSKPAHETVVR
ncbi:MAG: hypothetical protein XU12_C0008G0010 [Deltaproteobacteria bacterium CSP1-8]|nr:MAG: hypothetical protein XU12_C0008G0010 [Deltaproteobacteria bacterium CSP1-8]